MDKASLIPLTVTYRKTLSFGQFNSHSSEASVTVQIASMDDLKAAFDREHAKLRIEVDSTLIRPGFIPNREEYSKPNPPPVPVPALALPVKASTEVWTCSPGQQAAIKNLVKAMKLPPKEVRALAKNLFGINVEKLDRAQADKFITELFARSDREVEVVEIGKPPET